MLNKPDTAWALPTIVDGSVGVAAGVDVGVVLNGAAKPLGCVDVFVFGLEAKTFIPRYDAPELEAATKVFDASKFHECNKMSLADNNCWL